jgi:transcriptional regulator with XRE-family HTH domain
MNMTLGEKIKEARKQCGLTQEQLAEKMLLSRSAIAKWESDKGLPDVENASTSVPESFLRTSLLYVICFKEKDTAFAHVSAKFT